MDTYSTVFEQTLNIRNLFRLSILRWEKYGSESVLTTQRVVGAPCDDRLFTPFSRVVTIRARANISSSRSLRESSWKSILKYSGDSFLII